MARYHILDGWSRHRHERLTSQPEGKLESDGNAIVQAKAFDFLILTSHRTCRTCLPACQECE